MNNYWAKRIARSQDQLTQRNIKETEKQLAKYYATTMAGVLQAFEDTYNKLLATMEAGKAPTPADLYKLDKYWQLQGQLRQELEKLGNRQAVLLSKNFERNFNEVYHSMAMPSSKAFTELDTTTAKQMINSVWVADGKSWSQRIWGNTDKLQAELNEHLIECVAAGKPATKLKKVLQEDFNVSFNRADALVRTEMAHIQTQAAQKRYKDYGIKQVEVFVDEDEKTCPVCAAAEGKRYNINDVMPVPFHPRCRCCMVPVIDIDDDE